MAPFREMEFQQTMEKVLEDVRKILHATKKPVLACDVHHKFDDKYRLAEFVVSSAMASQLTCLHQLGLTQEQLATMNGWAKESSVTLEFSATERCSFLREASRDAESPTKVVQEHHTSEDVSSWTSKVVTTIKEFSWRFEVDYELAVFPGTGSGDRIVLQQRSCSHEVKTATNATPHPAVSVKPRLSVNLTWLLHQQIQPNSSAQFHINREAKSCATPRRNDDVTAALKHFHDVFDWAGSVRRYFEQHVFPVQKGHGLEVSALKNLAGVFIPVMPILQQEGSAESETESLWDGADVNRFLAEEQRSLEAKNKELAIAFPADASLITVAEAVVVVTLLHVQHVADRLLSALDFVESMLRNQLIAAIGKEVKPSDFAAYMKFHNRKLFLEPYEPRPFCYAVRRTSSHGPEGTISIEETAGEPVATLVHCREASHPMQFPLNASVNVTFGGDRYLHATCLHQFSGQAVASLQLVGRARQFSSMMVLVGRIASANVFEPTCAAIIQNKDELSIPLQLSTIPTPKEFKDAIESLSPEQQEFAKAFRAMQLESTLFGICVIQIKPQLEKVLGLAEDALTKEIKLTQDLMELFIKYQIPTDQISFNGDQETSAAAKLAAVKDQVNAMQEMIKESKAQELEEARMKVQLEQQTITDLFDMPMGGMSRSRGSAPAPARSRCNYSLNSIEMEGGRCRSLAPQCQAKSAHVACGSAVQAQQPSPVNQHQGQNPSSDGAYVEDNSIDALMDFTKVPKEMDRRFEELDEDGSLRPTIITTGDMWSKSTQKALLGNPEKSSLNTDGQKSEKQKAFDLLDALTRSGALPIDHASLHVVLAATHCFDKTILETVIQDNVSPIEKVERSTLIMASTIHRMPAAALMQPAQMARVQGMSPMLFDTASIPN